jgi:hypothetical protein
MQRLDASLAFALTMDASATVVTVIMEADAIFLRVWFTAKRSVRVRILDDVRSLYRGFDRPGWRHFGSTSPNAWHRCERKSLARCSPMPRKP